MGIGYLIGYLILLSDDANYMIGVNLAVDKDLYFIGVNYIF